MDSHIADKIIKDHIQLTLENHSLKAENTAITQLLIKARIGLEYGIDAQLNEVQRAKDLYSTKYKPQRIIVEEDGFTAIQDALESIDQFFGPKE